MKSKPVYGKLALDRTARRHLIITQESSVEAARRFVFNNPETDAYSVNVPAAEPYKGFLADAIQSCGMETAFYIVGSEAFVWEATQTLREAGVGSRRIQREIAGSLARKVYCVHCQTINREVGTTIHRCIQCGIALTVRDHFSRPLGAYMGVIADAETPGIMPEPEAICA